MKKCTPKSSRWYSAIFGRAYSKLLYRGLCEVGRRGRVAALSTRTCEYYLVCRDNVILWDEGKDVEGMHQFGELAASRQQGEEFQLAYLLLNSFKGTVA
jgi:hypothetical protein